MQRLLERAVEEALSWREEHLDPHLSKATDYYHAREYGDEKEGRSQVVTTEVRDAVQQMLPSIMRVLHGSERVAEYKPRGPEDVALAKQQTEYVNYVYNEDNPGFLLTYGAVKDALLRKMGILKWHHQEKTCVEGSDHTGMTPEDVQVLLSDPYIEDVEVLETNEDGTQDIRIRRKYEKNRIRVVGVSPEEFIFSPSAKDSSDAILLGQIQDVKASDLIAMGFDREEVLKRRGQDARRNANEVKIARSIDQGERALYEDEQDPSTRPVQFVEVYIQIGGEEGGTELHKVQAIGHDYHIVSDEIVDFVPYAIFAIDPEPHTMVGLDVADFTMEIQRIMSLVTRGMLDSLVQHLNPAIEIVDGEVNMKDLLNPELGRVIRTNRPGMMREVPTEFVGAAALPVKEHFKGELAKRIGISDASAGLDPDALQSTTRAAVSATVQAAQQRLELIVRMLAETGMKTLFKGLLRAVVQHQDEARVVRLRNEWVEVNPQSWDADKDVVVNVALGTGLVEEKLETLALIAEKQEQHLAQGSPLGSFALLRNTYARIIELMGYRNPDEFFPPFTAEQEAQYQQQKAQNQPPSEAEVLMQMEQMKAQARLQEKMLDFQLKVGQLVLDRERTARELALKEVEIDLKSMVDLTDREIAQTRAEMEQFTNFISNLQTMSQTPVGPPSQEPSQ